MKPVLGIDPGTHKCGWALVSAVGTPPRALGIAPLADFPTAFAELVRVHAPRAVALGRGTNAMAVRALMTFAGELPIVLVDERETTIRARARYFAANPPSGWRRFLPRGMLLPPRPIDDFAAVLIAERFLADESAVP